VRFVNLQYGDVREEIEAVERELGERVLQCAEVDNREDLDGLAALMGACDGVVSVGNATAHLCGAIGQRGWVLLPEATARSTSTNRIFAGWRWGNKDAFTPWYGSLQITRRPEQYSWSHFLDDHAVMFMFERFCAHPDDRRR
jgi:ADP-heptose:LPS heptosyltransferase